MAVQHSEQDAAMPRRGYPYKRCSDPKQKSGHSLERQEDWPKQVCAEQGWIYDDTYALADKGKSAFHGKNLAPTAGLTRFLKLIHSGRITRGSVLIIENLDRLSRAAVKKAQKLFQEILEAGIWICTKTPFRVYKDEDSTNFIDLLEPLWIMYCAYMESLKKSQRIGDLWQRDRKLARECKTPINAPPPFWLVKTPTGYEFSDKLPLLREIVHMSTALGLGAGLICKRMEERGIRGPGPSGKWVDTSVNHFLRSRTLIGEYQPCRRVDGKRVPDGPPIPGYYPAALTADEFAALQTSVRRRYRSRGRAERHTINLFTGLLYDAASKDRLVLRRRPHGTYLCRAIRHGNFIPYDTFRDAVLDSLMLLRPQDVMDRPAEMTDRERRIAALHARCVALEGRQEELQRAAADPTQKISAILPALRQVGEELASAAAERDRLKEESRSGRVEALAEARTLIEMRTKAAGEQQLRDLDERIKAALPDVVSEVWVQPQPVGPHAHITHVQIHLRSGAMRYLQLLPRRRKRMLQPWQLDRHDLRRGPYTPARQVGDATALAQGA